MRRLAIRPTTSPSAIIDDDTPVGSGRTITFETTVFGNHTLTMDGQASSSLTRSWTFRRRSRSTAARSHLRTVHWIPDRDARRRPPENGRRRTEDPLPSSRWVRTVERSTPTATTSPSPPRCPAADRSPIRSRHLCCGASGSYGAGLVVRRGAVDVSERRSPGRSAIDPDGTLQLQDGTLSGARHERRRHRARATRRTERVSATPGFESSQAPASRRARPTVTVSYTAASTPGGLAWGPSLTAARRFHRPNRWPAVYVRGTVTNRSAACRRSRTASRPPPSIRPSR